MALWGQRFIQQPALGHWECCYYYCYYYCYDYYYYCYYCHGCYTPPPPTTTSTSTSTSTTTSTSTSTTTTTTTTTTTVLIALPVWLFSGYGQDEWNIMKQKQLWKCLMSMRRCQESIIQMYVRCNIRSILIRSFGSYVVTSTWSHLQDALGATLDHPLEVTSRTLLMYFVIRFKRLPRSSGSYVTSTWNHLQDALDVFCNIHFNQLPWSSGSYVVKCTWRNFQEALDATLQYPFQSTQ